MSENGLLLSNSFDCNVDTYFVVIRLRTSVYDPDDLEDSVCEMTVTNGKKAWATEGEGLCSIHSIFSLAGRV